MKLSKSEEQLLRGIFAMHDLFRVLLDPEAFVEQIYAWGDQRDLSRWDDDGGAPGQLR